MSSRLYPCLYVNSLLDIPLEDLEQFNIKAFILDLDNTVTEWNSNKITQEVQEWFQQIKEADFRACILSNNDQQRIVKVAENWIFPISPEPRKPRRGAFYRAITLMGVEPNETAVIGDQILLMYWAAIVPVCLLFWYVLLIDVNLLARKYRGLPSFCTAAPV